MPSGRLRHPVIMAWKEGTYLGPHGPKSPEHYLPAGLGSFKGCDPLTDRVCRACNHELGRLDEVLLRTGDTGLLRHLSGVSGRDGAPPSPFERGAAGIPPIEMPGEVPGRPGKIIPLQVLPGTRDVIPIRHIVLELPTGEQHSHRISDRMRGQPERLKRELVERGFDQAKLIDAFAHKDDVPWMNDLILGLGTAPVIWGSLEVPGTRRSSLSPRLS
jgi:hypothetical protein